jgi:hypothetical protein
MEMNDLLRDGVTIGQSVDHLDDPSLECGDVNAGHDY